MTVLQGAMTDALKPGAVLFAKDIQRVARFYAELVPMTVALAEQDVIVLEAERHQLVVHAIPNHIAEQIEIAVPPARRTEVPVKLIFAVASIADARARAPALGGELNPPSVAWQARGFVACDGHDPEGNVVQFREPVPFTSEEP
jgi:predicted enzyme related to lactoylglutathione lyase